MSPRVGLVLGGGGARGYAHIRVIEAFEALGLRPAAIAGTSIGALVGAAYASGMSSAEMTAAAGELVGSHRQALRGLFSGGPNLFSLLGRSGSRRAILNPEGLIGRVLPDLAGLGFADLDIPFQAVATDFAARAPKSFAQGPLAPAIAASIALPGLFAPVAIEGRHYVDGGLTNPLPHDLIAGSCDIVVAVDVTAGRVADGPRGPSAGEALMGAIQIMLGALVEARLAAAPPDILIRPPVADFRILDLFRFNEILAAALPARDETMRRLNAAIGAGTGAKAKEATGARPRPRPNPA